MREILGAELERLADQIVAARRSKFQRTMRSVLRKLRQQSKDYDVNRRKDING